MQIMQQYKHNRKDEFEVFDSQSTQEFVLFDVLFDTADYFDSAARLCHLGSTQSLENPLVLICEGVLTFTICTDLTLKVLMEGREFFTTAWNVLDFCAFLSIILCIRLQYEVYYDEIFGISLISMRYLSLTVRMVVLLKQSYFVQKMQQQRDILIFKRSRNQDLSILDMSSEILNDSQFVETMKLVSE
ncbi:unnamed protein product (macronuclear) [Paramecium tetraurelia]|uniref:Ion transport domain-containing protein n=1 Tax=Paramecium tetraurelia TaxID=5888 RepID=A0DDN6_PARTE|nr:uncharacterized protein GSPATT00015994001 [Paramecium tetraurelia]CAK81153.1 unnamed protein product [Paramecium tetraurelia]|eukprot:XP_001448550.1 hypothetical protein (macronuclear) [Paramecium tetraurelia strain d4-2]